MPCTQLGSPSVGSQGAASFGNHRECGPARTGPAGIDVELDGQKLRVDRPSEGGKSSRFWLARERETWTALSEPPSLRLKGPHRYGPFKDAFRNRFVLVYGTRGTPAETESAQNRARFDGEVFWYRGNGSVDLVSDTSLLDPRGRPSSRTAM